MRLLILGGYGVFGGRLARLLADTPGLTILIAGRSIPKAHAFCYQMKGRSVFEAIGLDRDGDLTARFASLKPDLVVDASGPFQAYGDRSYRVVEACLAAGISYLDLADGADFVAGIKAYDEAARAKGVFVLSGVSTCPVLTAAVVRRLSHGLTSVTTIEGGIAPSPFAGVGLNVVRAIASYAGRPTAVRRDGEPATAYPFTEQRRRTIAPPGQVPLSSTLFSLVEVPDLQVLPVLWPEVQTAWFGAGPQPTVLHRCLIVAAWLRRWRLLPSLVFMAPLMHGVLNALRWGEHRGGMYVAIEGADTNGQTRRRSWHLLAEGDDGPFIPSMAAEIIVRKVKAGQMPAPGARSGVTEIELADYEALFVRHAISTGVREAPGEGTPVFARVLGAAWRELPGQIRAVHEVGETARRWQGVAQVRRGRNPLGRMIAGLFGFPRAGSDVPVSVTMVPENGAERWTRRFGVRTMTSVLREGSSREAHLLVERFGPVSVSMALVRDGEALRYVLRGWRLFGVPMPRWLGPGTETAERVDEAGGVRFEVTITHPLGGLLVGYEGWLEEAP